MIVGIVVTAVLAGHVQAYPWVAKSVGRDPVEMKLADDLVRRTPGDAASCPYNPNHVPAAPITAKYPYCGAIGGAPGFQVCANNLVPAKGDTIHYYQAPTSKDIRGPCPGLNTAANHGFLARDGITNFNELVDAQQNVYGVGYDLAVLLAALGVNLDGDLITQKLSISCDATTRTAAPGLGPELGLAGHDKFEGDTSLTRNDYFLGGGDNFSFNSTLYQYMLNTCGKACTRDVIALYRYQRYQQSLNENGNFAFAPQSVLLYGAASFLYTLFPSLGEQGTPDRTTMDYFFKKQQLPPNWYSRVDPYTIPLVAAEIFYQYEAYPVAFGGNTGKPNTFVGIGQYGPYIQNSMFNGTADGVVCLLYQLSTSVVPDDVQGGRYVSTDQLKWAASKLNPIYSGNGSLASYGCPINYNSS